MKVYLYYLTSKDIMRRMSNNGLLDWLGLDNQELPSALLYAYTTKKKVAKFFEYTRNMDVLKKRFVEMDEGEYQSLNDEMYKYACIKIEEIYYPIDDWMQHHESSGDTPVNLPFTTSEYWYCKECREETIHEYLYGIPAFPSIRIFTKEIQDILRDLGYCDFLMNVEGERISDMEELTELAKYTKYYAWKNTVGVLLLLYTEVVNQEGLFEVIGNAI